MDYKMAHTVVLCSYYSRGVTVQHFSPFLHYIVFFLSRKSRIKSYATSGACWQNVIVKTIVGIYNDITH